MTAPSLLSVLAKKKGREPQQAPRKTKVVGPTVVETTADSHKRKEPEAPVDPRPDSRTRDRVEASEGTASSSSMGAF